MQLISEMEAVWVREGSDIDIQDAPKTDFVIVGPIDKKSQKTTGIQWYTVLVVRYVYVIGWSTVVFGINSTSNAVRKCKIARGEAECYLLPDCIASAINPKYHSRPSYHRLILLATSQWFS